MAFAFTVIYLFYPETKGITLEEVEIILGPAQVVRSNVHCVCSLRLDIQ
jgi:hypothetical protein